MEALAKNKITLSILALFIIAAFGYRYFAGSSIATPQEGTAGAVGEDLIKLSDQLSRAQLSTDLFSVTGYMYLTDFTASVPEQPFGRTNPFGAIGQN